MKHQLILSTTKTVVDLLEGSSDSALDLRIDLNCRGEDQETIFHVHASSAQVSTAACLVSHVRLHAHVACHSSKARGLQDKAASRSRGNANAVATMHVDRDACKQMSPLRKVDRGACTID